MSKLLALPLLCLVALLPLDVQAQTVPHGTIARWHQHHAVFPNGMVDNRSGWVYSFPVTVPSKRHSVKTVHRTSHRNAPHSRQKSANHAPVQRPAPVPRGRYTASMLVTWYAATGSPMANGIYPSVGWAACGYDLALGQRVFVPGIGTLTCGDRIGYDPWRHIDVFGIPLGTGYRNVTVY